MAFSVWIQKHINVIEISRVAVVITAIRTLDVELHEWRVCGKVRPQRDSANITDEVIYNRTPCTEVLRWRIMQS